jgi:hypothetical protein
MNNYSYALQGNGCSPVTSALTSNRKFLSPEEPVYIQHHYTNNFITYPEKIKNTYMNKDHQGNINNDQKVECKSCIVNHV